MMSGEVTPLREAVLHLELIGPEGTIVGIRAVLDTGLTEFLTLPAPVIDSLRLPYYSNVEVLLGDGSTVLSNVFRAVVVWDGQHRPIRVHEADTDPLIGMSLLTGFHLAMDVVDGGAVSITPLA